MRIVLICHVEFGYASDSVVFDRRTIEGAREGIRHTIDIANQFGAKANFMVMPEVLMAVREIDFEDHQIGLHLHPNDICLTKKGLGGMRDDLRSYGFLEQKKMISAGVKEIENMLGVSPKIFVAGKWSMNNDTVRALTELGFTHDGSPCPSCVGDSYDWEKLPRICMPYRPSRSDYQEVGDMDLILVPVSKGWCPFLGKRARGLASPETEIGLGFLKAVFREYLGLGMPLFHVFFHSPAMTSRHCQRVFRDLLQYICSSNQDFCLLNEVIPMNGTIMPNVRLIWPYVARIDTAISFIFRRSVACVRKRLHASQKRH